jgi:hypothetical protein
MAGAGTIEQRTAAAIALSRAGFGTWDVNTFMRIASRESEFNPRAHNSVPPDDSYGLWQINTLSTPDQDLWGEVSSYKDRLSGDKPIVSSKEQLYDPELNARVAIVMFRKYKLNPWNIQGDPLRGTLPIDQLSIDQDVYKAAIEQNPGMKPNGSWWAGPLGTVADVVGGTTGAVSDVVGGIANVGEVLGKVAKLLANLLSPGWWKRLGIGLLGVALVVAGVFVWRAQAMLGPLTAAKSGKYDGEVAKSAVGKV